MDDYPSDTDSSDEEYIPGAAEEASDCEVSDGESDGDQDNDEPKAKRTKTSSGGSRRNKQDLIGSRKRKGGIQLDEEEQCEEENVADEDTTQTSYNELLGEKIIEEKAATKELQEKKKADDLWADFMSDVNTSATRKPANTAVTTNTTVTSKATPGTRVSRMAEMLGQVESGPAKVEAKKVTVTEEFDFAGEVVRITKEVEASSKEAKEAVKKEENSKLNTVLKPRSAGGLGSVLGKISKKPTISTLNKSKIDWDNFKKDEGIEDELKIHQKSKTGFLERQAFLQRADVRQYEAECAIRKGKTNNS